MTVQYPRCWRCNRSLAEYLTAPWSLRCHRCKAQNKSSRRDRLDKGGREHYHTARYGLYQPAD